MLREPGSDVGAPKAQFTMNIQKRCAACGQLFALQHPAAKYCGPSCRSPRRPGHDLETRIWNGRPIQRRPDGYINATAMAKAAGRQLCHYMANVRSREYLQELAAVIGIPMTGSDGVMCIIQGGQPDLQGTWVHPRLAVDIARWASPVFAVWMDGWVLEHLQGSSPPVQNRPSLPPVPAVARYAPHLQRRLDRMDHLYQWARRLVVMQHPGESERRFNYGGRVVLQDVLLGLMLEMHGDELYSSGRVRKLHP
jgi:hypothetical protein